MIQLIYYNAVTLPTPQGEGHHGNIDIIINPTLYTTLSNTACTNPTNLGVYPTVTTNANAAH